MKEKRKLVKFYTLFILLFFVTAYGFNPQPGSPLAQGVHPRLHITPESIPEMRAGLQKHYAEEFQSYVNWASNLDSGDKHNVLDQAGHDPMRAAMVHQAFISAIGQLDNINYPASIEYFAAKAIAALIDRLKSGQELSYVSALTYDWTYNFMSDSERQQIANLMLNRTVTHKVFDHSIANPAIDPEQMFSSKYFEGCYAWYIALAFWGDGIIDAQADKAVDSFYDIMLNYGYLDAHNFAAGNDGGWSEWIGYASWHPRTHFLNIDGWRTATGEDYFVKKGTVEGNAVKNYPLFMHYALDPHKYFDENYSYVYLGGAETTDCSFDHGSMGEQMHVLPRLLKQSGLNEQAGLLRYMIENYNVKFPDYEHSFLWAFLGLHKSVDPVTPNQIQAPRSLWARNMGAFFARTGFGNEADGVFTVSDGHFRFNGHKGVDDFPGFSLTKFGTLVNTRKVAHRGYGNLNDYPGGHQFNIVYFEGGHEQDGNGMDEPHELQQAANGQGDYDHGGIEQVTRNDGNFYHVRVNRDRQFENGVSHTREFIWLPGENPESDSDFMVVYDRTEAPTQPEWIYHVPWAPEAMGYNSKTDISSGSGESGRMGESYSGSGVIVKELNSLGGERDSDGGDDDFVGAAGAHGVAFSKTILPQNANVEVTRVASFDSQVIKRQHHLAIKSNRWQVAVKPQESGTDHRFLHVFQTADANKVESMTDSRLIEVGDAMQGVWIEKETNGRPNYVALFSKQKTINENVVTYSVQGSGKTVHVISGLTPYTNYEIKDIQGSSTNSSQKFTEPDISLWDYKGVADNQAQGVLYFESTLSGNHTFVISKSGQRDSTPPQKPTGLIIKSE